MKSLLIFFAAFSLAAGAQFNPVTAYNQVIANYSSIIDTLSGNYLLGGRPISQWIEVMGNITVNTAAYIKNGNRFLQSFDQMITFYYNVGPSQWIQVTNATVKNYYKPGLKTLLICHEWGGNYNDPFVNLMVQGYVAQGVALNILAFDYSIVAQSDYLTISAPHVWDVALVVANFMTSMTTSVGLSLSNVILIGHSLGGQVGGAIGNFLNGQIGECYCMDSSFLTNDSRTGQAADYNNGITYKSCKYVQAISTNHDMMGAPLATISGTDVFFVNMGGQFQPSCGWDFIICPHHFSVLTFWNSLFSQNVFVGNECSSGLLLSMGWCASNGCARLGPIQYRTAGQQGTGIANSDYYIFTNNAAPYTAYSTCPNANFWWVGGWLAELGWSYASG